MIEEEKKAIVRAREHIIDPAGNYLSIEETETLLNIIDEQQNEIEDQHKELVDLTYSLTFDYISKDKIRDKIEQIDKEYSNIIQGTDINKNLDYINIVSAQHNSMKTVLEELLER